MGGTARWRDGRGTSRRTLCALKAEETLKEVEKETRGRETYWQVHNEACFSWEVREDGVLAG